MAKQTFQTAPEVIVASQAGFCPGVKRAVNALEERLADKAENARIFTLGPLIHNPDFVRETEARGAAVAESNNLPELLSTIDAEHPMVIITRAHGVPRATAALLKKAAADTPFLTVVDCTCPYVAKIHDVVAQYDDGAHVLFLLGTAGHPEVEGIVSRFDGPHFIFSNAQTLEAVLAEKNGSEWAEMQPILAAQTTSNTEEWKKSQEILKKLYTNPLIFDTICSVTEKRQAEAAALSRQCDGMLVIGGRNSSNTAKLFSICRAGCPDTLWIENASELPFNFKATHRKVGIVAGASTPGDKIQEVVKTMDQENFSEMLDGMCPSLNTGDVVTGIVEYVTDGELQLDLGMGVTGYIKADQVSDDPSVKLPEQFKRGDKVEAFVIRVSDVEGVAELSKKRADADREWKNVLAAVDSHEVLEGKVVDVNKGGVVVAVAANQVFVPASQTGVPKDGDLNALKGETVKLEIIEVRDRKKVVGSISRVQKEIRKQAESAFWDTIEEGKVYTGPVKSMTSYGAFIDLGGVDGMVHMTELSWKRIKSPADVLKIGQEITVFVKSFDREARRISLGYKTEADNPWNIFTSQYAVGDVANVTIVNLMPFGAFAEIVDGVDGLIHISQIANTRIANPADVLQVGQQVDVRIIEIDNEKQKVGLSIRALMEEEQPVEEAPAEEQA